MNVCMDHTLFMHSILVFKLVLIAKVRIRGCVELLLSYRALLPSFVVKPDDTCLSVISG